MFKPLTVDVMTEGFEDHRAARAWSLLHPERADPESIDVLKRKGRSAVYRLNGVGSDGRAIIAKRGPTETAHVEHSMYVELFPRMPLPVLRCHGFVKEPEGKFSWLFLEDAGGDGYSPSSPTLRVLMAQWLGAMHIAAMNAGFEQQLPDRGPSYYLTLLQSSRDDIRELCAYSVLPAHDEWMLNTLLEGCDRIEAHWNEVETCCENAPHTVVHGDLVAKNVRVRNMADRPALLVFDWEKAGWGTPAVDLARFVSERDQWTVRKMCGVVSPDLDSYRAVLREYLPGDLALEDLADCGTLFRLLEDISWESALLDVPSYDFLSRPLSCLHIYQARLHGALQTRGWV